jgi:hypothetical protein
MNVIAFMLMSVLIVNTLGLDCDKYYAGHGEQWVNVYDNCTDDASQQSPVDVAISENIWKDFVFLPAYGPITPTKMGMEE